MFVINSKAKPKSEKGQMLILFMLFMTVTFVVAVIAIDVGFWVTERRGAQTDADNAALSGAWHLLDPSASAADASSAALANLAANDQTGNAEAVDVIVDDSCWNQGRLDSVVVNANHVSPGLFSSLFGIDIPVPGAHARACVGAAFNPRGMIPFQVNNDELPCFNPDETPNFTALCAIDFGAATQNSGSRGLVDLTAPDDYCSDSQGGAAETSDMIEYGSNANCLINTTGVCDPSGVGPWYRCVSVQPGNPKAVLDGVGARLMKEGLCDKDGDGIDSFEEATIKVVDTGNPFTSIYEGRDCDPSTEGKQLSPRLGKIFVFDEEPSGNASVGNPIDALAGFYIAGCLTEKVDDPTLDVLNRKCTGQGKGKPPGLVVVYGNFVNLIVAEAGGVTAPDESTTLFSIDLVE